MENLNYPDELNVVIPPQKYDPKVYREPENCYLAKVLKELGYKNVRVNPTWAMIDGNYYVIEGALYCAKLIINFENNEPVHVKLIKL